MNWKASGIGLLTGMALTLAAATPKTLEIISGSNLLIPLDYEPKITYDRNGPVTVQYLPSAGKLAVISRQFGNARIHLSDQTGTRDIYDVKVVPPNWSVYQKLIQDAPNLRLDVGGGKVLISGKISSQEEVGAVKQILALDEKFHQVVNNTVMDSNVILSEAAKFLKENKFHKISLKLMNRVVFMTGEVYDPKRRDQVVEMMKEYFGSLGCSVNSAGLNITNRKIAMRVMFLDIDKEKLRQAGITFNSPVKWSLSFNKIAEYFSIGEGNQGAHLDSITGTINILQNKKIAKVVYENQLSTLSGEKAQFQEGGVLNVKIYSQYNTDLKEIEYGFQVAATPYTIDDETIAVDFDMSQLRPKNQNAWTSTDSDKDLSKYMTKSKYTMAAGSGKVISSIIMNGESLSSSGLPWLADLPWVGSWLFGSTSRGANEHELLLILHVDWEDAEVRERELVFQQKKQKAEDVRKESRSALKEAGL